MRLLAGSLFAQCWVLGITKARETLPGLSTDRSWPGFSDKSHVKEDEP